MESGYLLGKLKLSQKVLMSRTGGKAEKNISSIMYPRDVKIRIYDYGTLVLVFFIVV